jgi:hypothetical protein
MSVSPSEWAPPRSGGQRKAWDLNPHPAKGHGLANRLGQPYPTTFQNPVDPPGIEPGFPPCRGGVVPLDHEPVMLSGPDGSRTHRTDLARVSRLLGTCQPIAFQRSVRESNPVSVPTTDVCCRNTYRPSWRVIPAGVEPALSCMSRRRLRRWTTGSPVTRVGIEPTGTRLSTSPLCRFAYPVVAGPGVAPSSSGI